MSSARVQNQHAADTPQDLVLDARAFGSLSLLRGNPPHFFIPNPTAYYAIREATHCPADAYPSA
jgi:hypothetical protein